MSNPVVGFDCETGLIGLTGVGKRATFVCATFAGAEDSWDWCQTVATHLGRNALVRGGPPAWELLLIGAEEVTRALQTSLENSDGPTFVAHNMAFDALVVLGGSVESLHVMWQAIEDGRLRDTMVRELLLATALGRLQGKGWGFGLADVCKRRLDRTPHEEKGKLKDFADKPRETWPWRLRYIDLLGVSPDAWPAPAVDYACQDATDARDVFLDQSSPLRVDNYVVTLRNGVIVNEREQTKSAMCLHMAAHKGIMVDEDTVRRFGEACDEGMAKVRQGAAALGILVINRCDTCDGTGVLLDNPLEPETCPICHGWDHQKCLDNGIHPRRKANGDVGKERTKRKRAIVRAWYEQQGLEVPMTERPRNASESWTPSVSTKADNLEAIAVALPDSMGVYYSGLTAKTWNQNFRPPLERTVRRRDKTLHTNPNVLVASGRTSWRGPNLQNPPQKGLFRECFIARPGRVFASIDYNSLEMGTLAQACLDLFGKSVMAEIINAGRDLHAFFGKNYVGVDYDGMKALLAARDAVAAQMRKAAKPVNFGLPGGLGAAGLVRYAAGYGLLLHKTRAMKQPGSGIIVPSAKDLRRDWFDTYPEMKEYMAMLSRSTRSRGHTTIRQLRSNRVRGKCSYTAGANTFFQGLAADGIKDAMARLFVLMYLDESSPLFGCDMLIMIHDELIVEGPAETAHIWAPLAAQIMVEAMQTWTPDVAVGAPPALMRKWYKKADELYDDQDELIPWEPWSNAPPALLDIADEDWTDNQRSLAVAGFYQGLFYGYDLDECLEYAEACRKHGRMG